MLIGVTISFTVIPHSAYEVCGQIVIRPSKVLSCEIYCLNLLTHKQNNVKFSEDGEKVVEGMDID